MKNDPMVDELFVALKREASVIASKEPMLRPFLEKTILNCTNFAQSLGRIVSAKLATDSVGKAELFQICMQAYTANPELLVDAVYDIRAVCSRDPASTSLTTPFLYLKGPHVLESWRISHWLWQQGRHDFARYMQSVISDVFSVDIHPAATIGHAIMLDHATGIVIGETARVADMVSLLHDVTLGGTGKESGDRHPKVETGVMIGAGAKILGNIHIGQGAKIGAGSVVLADVEPHSTVAGIPARLVGTPSKEMPSLEMDQTLDTNLPVCGNSCGLILSKRV